ncbi:hypothetical protein HHI36_023499 [Cryptolaemus montrouzieri]|uniref:Uncharacterized protein n=1 Tax=Cryptolaemus montrouzieri TaxID=559131 RepID=A0ABD2PGI8_9CUCU
MHSKKILFLRIVLICMLSVNSKNLPDTNNSSVFISEYAKVAHWGSGRSSQGQIPWTQRSDASINYGQNLKNHRSYDTSKVPAIGEVEERFNPKPYFTYGSVPGQKIPSKDIPDTVPVRTSSSISNGGSPVYLPTISPPKVLQVPVLPTVEPKPHEDPYTSPYSSYNPPKQSETYDSYMPHRDKHKQPDVKDYSSFNLQNNDNNSDDSYLPQMDSSMDNNNPSPLQSSEDDMENHGPPNENDVRDMHEPPSSESEYYPSNGNYHSHKEVILDHPPSGYKIKKPQMDHSSPDEDIHDHKEVILDHPPPGYEDMDHQMPPESDDFPHYLYDEGHTHHDHHVYQEVEEPKEQKRVSKPQYSYYYIGRKLWYIPLYFSVYFIIYVTFLILKSIARHKIQFKHDFLDHHNRESRQLTNDEDLNNLHQNVSVALANAERKKIALEAM